MPLVDTLLSLIAPHDCLGCNKEGAVLCAVCRQTELTPLPSRCYRCKKATIDYVVCPACRRQTALKHVWVRAVYDDISSRLVLAYKFKRAYAAHKPIARGLRDILPVLAPEIVVVGVPSTTARIRERGYDHIRPIVRELARATDWSYSFPLVRLGQAHQFGAGRQERLKQLKNSFLVKNHQELAGKQVLIVDDVLTTGATLETVAKYLKQAGAKRVDAVVFAQKL